jgi:hypothetical protein
MPTPNWKKATLRTAYAAKEASSTAACECARGSAKNAKKTVGRASVGTLKLG